jgi:hypothetical protein
MAVTHGSTFGNHLRAGSVAATPAPTTAKKVATFWLNIGYSIEVDVMSEIEGMARTETRFISLQSGIALDTLADLPTNGSDKVFRSMQSARNDLRDQLLQQAQDMVPGEERIIGSMESGLQLQLRRVNEAKPDIKASENPFTKRLSFAQAA